jgi:hypothetical protein
VIPFHGQNIRDRDAPAVHRRLPARALGGRGQSEALDRETSILAPCNPFPAIGVSPRYVDWIESPWHEYRGTRIDVAG